MRAADRECTGRKAAGVAGWEGGGRQLTIGCVIMRFTVGGGAMAAAVCSSTLWVFRQSHAVVSKEIGTQS